MAASSGARGAANTKSQMQPRVGAVGAGAQLQLQMNAQQLQSLLQSHRLLRYCSLVLAHLPYDFADEPLQVSE